VRVLWMLALCCGCGRLGFEPHATPDGENVLDIDAPAVCSAPYTPGPFGCHVAVTTPTAWADARSQCLAMAGRLVTIDSAAENELVRSLVAGTQRIWIGLTDQVVERVFVWESGAPLTYTNWATGEPNSQLNDCVELNGGAYWNEEDCAFLDAFVCEQ
jgi:hypothetical protein